MIQTKNILLLQNIPHLCVVLESSSNVQNIKQCIKCSLCMEQVTLGKNTYKFITVASGLANRLEA
jgi:succinate dehydrogenase/fumarate reductase-like Fe-S protein